ncbi:hypothetical protein Fmac_026795 [Flemingia macrophylla]|uniref:Uncharacterized protein n=1 Tax=Flemingia macrophylla TaxID=520843 RepID=A0ABD1LG28_9FABA
MAEYQGSSSSSFLPILVLRTSLRIPSVTLALIATTSTKRDRDRRQQVEKGGNIERDHRVSHDSKEEDDKGFARKLERDRRHRV